MTATLTDREMVELKKWSILQAKEVVQIDKTTTDILTKAREIFEWATEPIKTT